MPITSVANLVTLEEALKWLDQESDGGDQDALVTAAIATASLAVANYIGYDPNVVSYVETVDGKDTPAIYVRGFPLISVTSITVNDAALSSAAYRVTPERIVMKNGDRFPRGLQNVTVTYSAGFSTMPEVFKQAMRMAVKAIYSAKSVDPNIAGESVPGVYSVTYAMGQGAGRTGISAGTMPLNAQIMLDPFRRFVL